MSKETPRKESLWTESTNKDYCTISTILEELIFVFDDDAQFAEKSRIDRLNRMRLALTVLGDSGYARLMSTTATTPMAVPTAKLSIVLDHDYLTTDVEPLIVPPLNADVCNSEGMSHSEYMQAFSSAMTNGMAGYVQVQTAILHMWAVGLLCHRRAAGGRIGMDRFQEGVSRRYVPDSAKGWRFCRVKCSEEHGPRQAHS